MKKREILLIVALVIFGFVYQAIEKGKVQFTKNFSFYSDERRLKGSQFVEFPEKEQLFSLVNKVIIENHAGEVTITKSSDDQVHVASFLRIYYSKKHDVDEIHKKIAIKTDFRDGDLKVSSQCASAFPYQHARIYFRLLVPEGVILTVSNQEGDIIIRGIGKNIYLTQENGNLFVENIPSSLKLQIKNGNANIKRIAAQVDINASHANVYIENAVSLHIRGKHGDYSIKNVKKNVFIEHSFGKLTLDDVDNIEISAKHSDIVAKNIKNGAVITNKYENILLDNITGNIRLSSRMSKIDLRHFSGKNAVIENSFADINISDYSGENLDVLLKNGNLDLQVKNIVNRINIESKYAKLNLVFGILSDPTFNIKTNQGRIFDQLPFELEKYEENSESFANRVGQNPEILINNHYGDVYLRSEI
jgi:DUF4097 and DUF4098 domain-containing protein YvlB